MFRYFPCVSAGASFAAKSLLETCPQILEEKDYAHENQCADFFRGDASTMKDQVSRQVQTEMRKRWPKGSHHLHTS